MSEYGSLLVFIAVTVAAAASGSKFMPGPWYERLRKPSWTPPNWAFPIVWTVLYLMIAIAGWRVWLAAGWSGVLAVWGLQLVLNAAWSYIMFGRRNISLAMVDALAMWGSIAWFMVLAWPIDQTAALLFAPYLLWVTIAAALNASILRQNPEFAVVPGE
jgi:translocator protein